MNSDYDAFWHIVMEFPPPGDEQAFSELSEIAFNLRNHGKDFSAGYVMEWASHIVASDGEKLYSCIATAIKDYSRCLEIRAPNTIEALAALVKLESLNGQLRTYFLVPDESSISQIQERYREELAQRLITYFGDSPYSDNYLVKGVWLRGNLEGDWEPEFPQWEIPAGWVTWSTGQRTFKIGLRSAFQLSVAMGDYQAANAIIERCPTAFTTPGLRGWQSAVRGFVNTHEASEWFAAAGEAFAKDEPPQDDQLKQRGLWSAENIDLWARYFRSRSALAAAVREPERAKELVKKSAAAIDGHLTFAYSEVVRYQILVQTLAHLVGEEPSLTPAQARERLLREARWPGRQAYDEVSLQFLNLACEALEGFKADPAQELASGRLPLAFAALARIPIIGPEITNAVQRPIAAKALETLMGPMRTWIYRTLESIVDENILRRIILRLAQASLPMYAQIRHGPIEYGKDVVVLLEVDGRKVLRMYQVKCGDITKPKWRESQDELEETFLVPLSSFQLPSAPDSLETILVCNGHVNPYVEPVMLGWFQAQENTYGRTLKFMSLDQLVQWITGEKLINEFRAAITELGLQPVI